MQKYEILQIRFNLKVTNQRMQLIDFINRNTQMQFEL